LSKIPHNKDKPQNICHDMSKTSVVELWGVNQVFCGYAEYVRSGGQYYQYLL
jgi:hypothetical protein